MDLSLIWKAVLIVVAGTVLLRIAGRKSVSQMTIAQTILMISIGTLLIQPVVGKNIWTTLIVGGILVGTLAIMEYAQIKGDFFEKMITGKSKVLIENGNLNESNIKKMRLTVDQLEMNLREKNVMRLSDVEWATIEPNGKIGYALKSEAQPVTKKEFQQFANHVNQTLGNVSVGSISPTNPANTDLSALNQQLTQLNTQLTQMNQGNIFQEVGDHEHKTPPPEHLQ